MIHDRKALPSARAFGRHRRSGVTMIECVVAASVLLVAMGTVTTMSFRVGRLWMDVGNQRIAMSELTNTLELITELPRDEIDQALANLIPSPTAEARFDQPELIAERVRDEFGDRVILSLSWNAAYPIRAVQLVGWIETEEISP